MTKPSKDLGVVYLSIKYIGDQRVICASNTREPNFEPYIPLQSYTALQVKLEMAIEALEFQKKEWEVIRGDKAKHFTSYQMLCTALTNIKKDQA